MNLSKVIQLAVKEAFDKSSEPNIRGLCGVVLDLYLDNYRIPESSHIDFRNWITNLLRHHSQKHNKKYIFVDWLMCDTFKVTTNKEVTLLWANFYIWAVFDMIKVENRTEQMYMNLSKNC